MVASFSPNSELISMLMVIPHSFVSLNSFTFATRVSPSGPVQEFQKSMVIGPEAASDPAESSVFVSSAVSPDVSSFAGADSPDEDEPPLSPEPPHAIKAVAVMARVRSNASFFFINFLSFRGIPAIACHFPKTHISSLIIHKPYMRTRVR